MFYFSTSILYVYSIHFGWFKHTSGENEIETTYKWLGNRTILSLILSFGLLGAAGGLAGGTLVLFMKSLGIPELAIAYIASVVGISRCIMDIVAGWFSDKFSRKIAVIVGLSINLILPLLLYAMATSSELFIVAKFLAGAGASLAATSLDAWLSDICSKEVRGSVFGARLFSTFIASSSFTLLGTIFATFWGFRLVYYFGVLIGIMAVLLVVPLREDKAFSSEKSNVSQSGVSWKSAWPVIKSPTMCSISYAAALTHMLMGGLIEIIVPFVIVSRGGSLIEVGIVATAFRTLSAIGQVAGGSLSDKVGRKAVIVAGIVLSAVSLSLVSLFFDFLPMVLLFATSGLGMGSIYSTMNTLAADLAPTREVRGKVIGYWRFWRDSGDLIGPIVLGTIYVTLGALPVLYLMIFLLAIGAVLTAIFVRK